MIGTAYGLMIMHQIDAADRSLIGQRPDIVRTLLEMQHDEGGWSPTSQATSRGQPESTAWALCALHECGYDREVRASIPAVAKMFEDESDDGLWHHVFSVCSPYRCA